MAKSAKVKSPKTRGTKVSLSETIDLCESDSGEDIKICEKVVETITLDESSVCDANISFSANYSLISDATLNLTLTDDVSPSTSKAGTKRKTDDESENDDEIQIVGIQPGIPSKRAKKSPASLRFNFNRRLSGKRQNQPFFFDVLGSKNNTDTLDLMTISGRTISKRKKRRSKLKSVQKTSQSKNKGKGSNSSPNKKPKKQAAKAEQARQILRSHEYAHNKFYQNAMGNNFTENNNRKKGWIPLKDGKPKFRMEPTNLMPILTESSLSSCVTNDSSKSVPSSCTSDSVGLMTESGRSSRTVTEAKGPDGESSFKITTGISSNTAVGVGTAVEPRTESAVPASRPPDQVPSQSHWSIYGSNAYHSGPLQTRAKGTLRPIVIDGSNVAMGHGNRKAYSCRGIQLCSDYFKGRGHSVIAFVPRFRQKSSQSQDTHILEELENAGIVKFTPSREVDGKRISSYDDRFIVQFAADSGGIIVSNDNFRDLYEEQPLWRETIRNSILQFTWINENYIMFPPDPLGCRGPTLDEFLRF